MKLATILATGMLLALSIGKAAADIDPVTDAIVVTPEQAVVRAGNEVAVNVMAANAEPVLRPRASLIIYKPDGTMLKARYRHLRKANARFRLVFGTSPQIGTYTVYATVEAGSQAFGMPMEFEITSD